MIDGCYGRWAPWVSGSLGVWSLGRWVPVFDDGCLPEVSWWSLSAPRPRGLRKGFCLLGQRTATGREVDHRPPSVWAGAGSVATTPANERPGAGPGGSGYAIWFLTGWPCTTWFTSGQDWIICSYSSGFIMGSCVRVCQAGSEFSRVVRLSEFGRFSSPGEGWFLIDG